MEAKSFEGVFCEANRRLICALLPFVLEYLR